MTCSNKLICFASLLLLISTCVGCTPPASRTAASEPSIQPAQPTAEPIAFEPVDQTDIQSLVDGNTRFALELYRQLQESQGNLFFSPYSISLALGMTYAGARSETEKQMAEVLHFTEQQTFHPAVLSLNDNILSPAGSNDDDDQQRFQLNIANSIWGQEGFAFQPDFLSALSTYYGAGMQLVDYINAAEDARRQINAWVEDETEDKIKDLIPSGVLDSMTRLVLANAIYFNAAWEHQFEEQATQDAPFTLLDGSEISVPTMNQHEKFTYMEKDGLQVIELPYGQQSASMVILLPEREAFRQFEAGLDQETLASILDSLQPADVQLSFPKFSFDSQFDLVAALNQLGLSAPFDPQVADFSGMDGARDLYISNILHKAFIDVDENGTEAAAATAVVMKLTSAMPTEPVEVKVDHPFIFLIRDNESGSILFMGRILDPR